MKKKTKLGRNLEISSRITLSTIFGIIVPVIIIVIGSSIFFNKITSYFDFASVTTDSYSMLNQIQWNQTMASISNELISSDKNEVKYQKVDGFVKSLEKYGTKICIEQNNKPFYSTADKRDTLNTANSIIKINTDNNLNYFGENGMVIVTHIEGGKDKYLVIIANPDYKVEDVSTRNVMQDYSSLVFGKTGLLFALIILIFIISIIVISIITSKTISKPIKQLAEGANEISNGNLNHEIDYESTNEIGQTVDAFNHMTKRLKQSISAQEKLEGTRIEMIAGVAHDLRTPLTSIKGYVEGLRDGIASTPEMQERYLSTIYSSALSMERLLDDLLTVSRLETGTIELNREIININSFLDDCAEELTLELQKQDFDFEYNNLCTEPIYVNLDASNFSRVIRNIVSNSIKYSRKDIKGKIEMSVSPYEKSIIITIKDNGIGLDEKSLMRIFETFYRADKARTRVHEGSGIGLSVCKQIVELHGGNIWATSTEGEGLTIHISLNREEID
ncbi:MAG: HAMP domain-containing protein [Eubacterium sp.]|nr:HAMP domain-containing protein [Eubacterium sp.]